MARFSPREMQLQTRWLCSQRGFCCGFHFHNETKIGVVAHPVRPFLFTPTINESLLPIVDIVRLPGAMCVDILLYPIVHQLYICNTGGGTSPYIGSGHPPVGHPASSAPVPEPRLGAAPCIPYNSKENGIQSDIWC